MLLKNSIIFIVWSSLSVSAVLSGKFGFLSTYCRILCTFLRCITVISLGHVSHVGWSFLLIKRKWVRKVCPIWYGWLLCHNFDWKKEVCAIFELFFFFLASICCRYWIPVVLSNMNRDFYVIHGTIVYYWIWFLSTHFLYITDEIMQLTCFRFGLKLLF